jgi:hypothetical protein
MPERAQDIGSVLPLPHFLRMVRGILLKGNGQMETLNPAAFMADQVVFADGGGDWAEESAGLASATWTEGRG